MKQTSIYIKIIVLFLFLLFFESENLAAQKIYFGVGPENAFFKDYKNNDGTTINQSSSQPLKPFFEMGIIFDTRNKYLKIESGVSYNTYEMKTSFTSGNIQIPLFYDLSYFAIKSGLSFYAFEINELIFKSHLHLSYDFLTSGTSMYYNVVNDLYQDNSLAKSLLRYHIGLGIEYPISDFIGIYSKYNLANSLFRVKDNNEGESYLFKTNSISFGLLLKFERISKYNCF